MSAPEMTPSTLIRGLLGVGALVTAPLQLDERINGICEMAVEMLGCDHVAVMQRNGEKYRGMWQYGLSERLDELFRAAVFPVAEANQEQIENCDTYLLYNDARNDPVIGQAAEVAEVHSTLIAPFTHADGSPLGYLTVSYIEAKHEITQDQAELSLGLARILQAILLQSLDTKRRRELSKAVLHVADSERRRLSRDIHDDPLQQMLSVRIGLEGFREKLADPELIETVERCIEDCRAASSSLREVMLQTHPNSSELADLEEVLTQMVSRKAFGSNVILQFSDERATASPSYLIPALNRVGEQAARNALRHARASELVVKLSDIDGGTLLLIADNGTGFDPTNLDPTRIGIVSMRERTELLGGTFTIASAAGVGTTVLAWFPHQTVETN